MQEVGGHRPTCRRSSFRLVDERPSVVERASTVGTAAGHGWPAVREAAIVGLGLAVGVTAWFRDAGQKPAPPPPTPKHPADCYANEEHHAHMRIHKKLLTWLRLRRQSTQPRRSTRARRCRQVSKRGPSPTRGHAGSTQREERSPWCKKPGQL